MHHFWHQKGQVPLFGLPRLRTVAIKLNFSIIWLTTYLSRMVYFDLLNGESPPSFQSEPCLQIESKKDL